MGPALSHCGAGLQQAETLSRGWVHVVSEPQSPGIVGPPCRSAPGWGHTCECGEAWCCCAIFIGPVPLLSPVHAACTGWRRTQSSLGRDTHPLVTAVLVPAATGCTQVRKQSEIRAREKASESTPPRQGRSLPVPTPEQPRGTGQDVGTTSLHLSSALPRERAAGRSEQTHMALL